jgi:hypothetical protein
MAGKNRSNKARYIYSISCCNLRTNKSMISAYMSSDIKIGRKVKCIILAMKNTSITPIRNRKQFSFPLPNTILLYICIYITDFTKQQPEKKFGYNYTIRQGRRTLHYFRQSYIYADRHRLLSLIEEGSWLE